MITLDGKIILRRAELSDAGDLLIVKNNREASRLLGGFKETYTEDDIKKWIEFHRNNPDEILYVIYDIALGIVVGHVGLYNVDKRIGKAEFGILIAHDSCRGKGYGSLCLEYMMKLGFEELGLNRIELSLLNENIPALRLYEKYGFQTEGVLKQAQYKNGRYYDVILMAILKSDYGI